MFVALGTFIGWVIDTIAGHILPVAVNNPLGILASNGNPAPWVDAMAVVGLYVDLPFLFLALSVLFAWKLIWLVVRLWRTVLEIIPMMG